MQKLIAGSGVALIIFITGLAVLPTSFGSTPGESNRIVLSVDQMLVDAETKRSSPLPENPKTRVKADLSIVVEISQAHPKPPALEARPVKLVSDRPTVIDLGLGEGIDNQEVALNFPNNSAKYRMFQRYRTSMSLSAEGPHLDLVDWRHFDSPWLPLPSMAPRRFRTLRSDQIDSSRFPTTTKSEILTEVRKHVGNDWSEILEFAKACRGPNDGACQVMISSMYLRIQKQVRGRWIDIGQVELRFPMGC